LMILPLLTLRHYFHYIIAYAAIDIISLITPHYWHYYW
jgi:hypothetical protein